MRLQLSIQLIRDFISKARLAQKTDPCHSKVRSPLSFRIDEEFTFTINKLSNQSN